MLWQMQHWKQSSFSSRLRFWIQAVIDKFSFMERPARMTECFNQKQDVRCSATLYPLTGNQNLVQIGCPHPILYLLHCAVIGALLHQNTFYFSTIWEENRKVIIMVVCPPECMASESRVLNSKLEQCHAERKSLHPIAHLKKKI